MAGASERSKVADGRGGAHTGLVVALLLGAGGAADRAQEPAPAITAAQLEEVMPGATRVGEVMGEPGAMPAYKPPEAAPVPAVTAAPKVPWPPSTS